MILAVACGGGSGIDIGPKYTEPNLRAQLRELDPIRYKAYVDGSIALLYIFQ